MDKKTKKAFAEIGIAAFGYLAENKIAQLEKEGKKSTWTEIARALSQDMQDHPERYYDFGEKVGKDIQKQKNKK